MFLNRLSDFILERRMSMQLGLKKNFVLNMLYQLLRIITPFITSPYISRVLGVSQLGVYSFTNSYLTYFTLFASLGTGTYGMREIARARYDQDKRSRLFWEIEILTILTSAITLACWFIFTMMHTQDRLYYMILSLNIIAVTFDISWFYAGMELFQYTLGINAFTKILSVVAILVFVKKPSDLPIYMFIIGGSTLLGNIAIWTSLPKFVHLIDLKTIHLKHHFKETSIYFLPTIASSVYNVMDKTMIWQITKSSVENGYYENANKVLDMMKTLTFVSLNGVVSSRSSYLFAKGEFERMKEKIRQCMDYVLFMGLGIIFGLLGITSVFVPWFFGPHYAKSIDLILIMSPVIVIIGISNVLGAQYYTPSGQRKKSTFCICMGAILNFVLNSIFIPTYKSYGAAVATVAAELLITFLYMHYANGYLKYSTLIKLGYKKLIAAICMLIVILWINHYFNNGAFALFLMVSAGFITYIVILLMLRDSFICNIIKRMKQRSSILIR